MSDFWDPMRAIMASASPLIEQLAASWHVDPNASGAVGTPNGGTAGGFAAKTVVQVQVSVTTTGAAGDKLDLFVDECLDPDQQVWANVGHYAQIAGNAGSVAKVATLGGATGATSDADYSVDAEAGVFRPTLLGDKFRLRATSTPSQGGNPTWIVEAWVVGR